MRTVLEFLFGSTVRSVLSGAALAGLVLFIGQFIGTPVDEDATLKERVQTSVSNISQVVDDLFDGARSPAGVDVKQKINLKEDEKAALNKLTISNNSVSNAAPSQQSYIDSSDDEQTYQGQAHSELKSIDSLSTHAEANLNLDLAESKPSKDPYESKATAVELSNDGETVVTSSASDDEEDTLNTPVVEVAATGSSSGESTISLTVSADYNDGSYSTIINVLLTSNNPSSSILYCLQEGSCCDPLGGSGATFTGTIPVGTTDGDFCLSFVSTLSGSQSPVVQRNYTIDSTLPNVTQNVDIVQLQSNEISSLGVSSTDIGNAGYALTQLNLKSVDPGATACSDILTNYPSVTYGIIEDVDSVSVLDLSTRAPASLPAYDYNFHLSTGSLDYGDNFLVSIVENTNVTPALYSCPSRNVVLKDFEIYNFDLGLGAPIVTGGDSSNLTGSFSSYGGFSGALNSSSVGTSQVSGTTILEHGFINIIN